MQSSSLGCRLPFELLREITGHNGDDVAALGALSLVSHTMRSMAIEELFSVAHFACAEDFARWLDMLSRTPRLVNVVKKVRLSNPGLAWLRRRRGMETGTNLAQSVVPPLIPPMPNVRVVEWQDGYMQALNPEMAVAHMAVFPNMQRLQFEHTLFSNMAALTRVLAACGSLKALAFLDTTTQSEPESDSSDSNIAHGPHLTELEELGASSTFNGGEDFLVNLVERFPPTHLRSLSFQNFRQSYQSPCSVAAMEKLLRLAAPSLVNLVIEPNFRELHRKHFWDPFDFPG
ncbi:hypothetical protein B0H15DRAFT_868385 [Mycena belliarum]|uniref:F-box domain-containing protein n=1 Tax=Mycena belliarum TaxID=1033014 RepID=A0AAD6TNC6_9AGAR|nr:hypothetical protein B0H15DRAFT_868385 [Mycena belliae]